MRGKILTAGLLPVLLIAGATFPAMAQDAQQGELRDCVRSALPDGRFSTGFVLSTLADGGRSKELSGQAFVKLENGRRLVSLRFDAPPDLAGVHYLIDLDDEEPKVYVHLSASDRTRYIKGSSIHRPLLGTGFSLEDLNQLMGGFQPAEVEGAETRQGREVKQLTQAPRPEFATDYAQLRSWIDAETCLPLRAELLRASGTRAVAEFDATSLQRLDSGWIFTRVKVADSSQPEGKISELLLTDFQANPKLSNRRFVPTSFHKF